MSLDSAAHTPVLVIGGGIVGLSASLFLRHHGIHSILVERHEGTSIHPRARSVNARTMELYRSVDIASAVREAGRSIGPSMGIFSGTTLNEVIGPKPRSEKKRKFPFSSLAESIGPEAGQFVTLDMIEPVLLNAARERGVDTRFYTQCVGVSQDEQGVTARLRNRHSGGEYEITALYCIAADGANSPIREQLGILRSGHGSYGNLLNILFTADLGSFVKGREFSIVKITQFDPPIYGGFTSINNSDRWVFHLSLDQENGEKADQFTKEKCEWILRKAIGIEKLDIEVQSILPWQASVRVAERIQEGRVLLAGDAAHQMPPYAGQGANSGISDAHNLAWKLAAVIKDQAGPKLLETYGTERLPVGRYAAEVSGLSADDRGQISLNKDLKTAKSLFQRLFIIAGFGYTYSGRGIVKEITWPLGGWTWKAWSVPGLLLGLDGRPGSRVPHCWVVENGKRISTTDLCGRHWALVTGSEGMAWKEAAREASERFRNVEVQVYMVGADGDIVDDKMDWEKAAGISSTGALLVRPDGFVAYRERRIPSDIHARLNEVMRGLLGL